MASSQGVGMRYATWMLSCCCCVGLAGDISAESRRQWEWIHVGAGETSFVAIAVDPDAPERVVAASEQRVYESADGGARWAQRFQAPSGTTLTDLAMSAQGGHVVILAATDRGLYGSLEGGTAWSRLFHGAGEG